MKQIGQEALATIDGPLRNVSTIRRTCSFKVYQQYAWPSAVGMLLHSSPKDTATQILQKVTRHRPQRMEIGPPLDSPLPKSCAKVDHVPRTEKAKASMLHNENFWVRLCSPTVTSKVPWLPCPADFNGSFGSFRSSSIIIQILGPMAGQT